MKVEEILKSKGHWVETIEVDASIAEAVGRLNGPPQIGALVVCDEHEKRPIVGTLTERDIIRGLGKYGAKLLRYHTRLSGTASWARSTTRK